MVSGLAWLTVSTIRSGQSGGDGPIGFIFFGQVMGLVDLIKSSERWAKIRVW
jgi:hypothetical protein